MKILVVEDDEDSRVLLESALEINGYEMESATDGKKALVLARQNPPDLIISDILMPEMDGYSLCRAIKSDEQLRSTPFVFYTATYTDPKDKQLAMDLGATKFFVKPMEINTLLIEIKKILQEYKEKNEKFRKDCIKMEIDIQKNYTDVLARKLDKKVRQLEEEKQRLAKSEKKYRCLVEALRDDYFFYTHDTNDLFTYISPSIQNVLGYTKEEFKAHYLTYLTDSPINNDVPSKTENSIKGINQSTYEIEIFHKNGSIHRIEVTENPVLDHHGAVQSVEGIAHDITKRILAEKELIKTQERLQHAHKMEAIGTLAAGIAHDFNNILTPIFGFTEMIKSTLPEDSKAFRNTEFVLTAAKRAKELVHQILTFSRHTEDKKQTVYLQSLLKETIKLMRSSIPTTIEIRELINTTCNPISANPIQMHQVIMNLCTNAYQAMRKKGGILAISLKEINICSDNYVTNLDLKEGHYLRLEVSDTGIGIEKESLKRIFEPYYTTKQKDEGTGLGLSVTHGIIKNHDGQIVVYSEPGQGTTFHVYLPVKAKKVGREKSHQTDDIVGGTEKILIVDDDDIIVNLEQKQLESLGYRVIALTSSVKAVEIFRQQYQDIDLVITDMTMPQITGSDLAKEMLSIKPTIPIILCTGFSELIDKKKALAIGIKEYLMKPMLKKDLARIIRKILDNK